MRFIERVLQDFFCSMCWITFTLLDVTEFSPEAGADASVTEFSVCLVTPMSESETEEQYLLFTSQSSLLD